MNIQDLKDLIEIANALGQNKETLPITQIGRKVIVRSRDAGVIFGDYVGNDGSTVHLRNGVQMWKWTAAQGISLIDVATYGVKTSGCKFSTAAATVTVFNACALIDVTDVAAASIGSVK
jgi:hypothetical protein